MSLLKRRVAVKPVDVDEEAERVVQLQKDKPTNPLQAIRSMCVTCMEGSYKRVDDCGTKDCPIHHFRLGKNPFRKKTQMSEERRAKLAENLAHGRETRKKNREAQEK